MPLPAAGRGDQVAGVLDVEVLNESVIVVERLLFGIRIVVVVIIGGFLIRVGEEVALRLLLRLTPRIGVDGASVSTGLSLPQAFCEVRCASRSCSLALPRSRTATADRARSDRLQDHVRRDAHRLNRQISGSGTGQS